MKSLRLLECNNFSEWDNFVKYSPQNNIFSHSWFLIERKRDYKFYFILKDDKIISSFILSLNKNNQSMPNPWIYHGIFFNKDFENLPSHKFTKLYIEIIEFLVEELLKKNDLIALNLHPSIQDIRPFQWSSFVKTKNLTTSINISSTSILNLSKYKNFDNYLLNIRKVRRQEYNRCIKLDYLIEKSKDIKTLNELHENTFKRQGIQRSDHDKLLCNEIARKAIDNNLGDLIICRNKNNEPVAGGLFLNDKKSCYYVVGATEEKERKNSPMTFIILEQIKKLFSEQIEYLDFCGINSPNRGDYKTSFNGTIINYFLPVIEKAKDE